MVCTDKRKQRRKDSPPTPKTTKDSPPTLKTTKDSPPTLKTTKDSPPTLKTTKDSSPTLTTTKDSPAALKTTKDSPPTLKTTKDSPPTLKTTKAYYNERIRLTLPTTFFYVFSTVHHSIELFHQRNLMHSFLYSLTICLLHYYPRHVSSINMPVISPLSTSVLCRRLQRAKTPDAV